MVPGVSINSNAPQRTHCFARVTPALSPVTVFLPPHSRLITVLLPVLGTPAIKKRTGFTSPFCAMRSRFSATSASIAAVSVRAAEEEFAAIFTAESPLFFMAASSESAPPSARSPLFNTYKTGFPPTKSRSLRLNAEAGARASKTNTAASARFKFSAIMRMAFAMCPGYH